MQHLDPELADARGKPAEYTLTTWSTRADVANHMPTW